MKKIWTLRSHAPEKHKRFLFAVLKVFARLDLKQIYAAKPSLLTVNFRLKQRNSLVKSFVVYYYCSSRFVFMLKMLFHSNFCSQTLHMFGFTSTLRRATLVILMARRPKFKLHFVSFTSPREGAMQICKTKFR